MRVPCPRRLTWLLPLLLTLALPDALSAQQRTLDYFTPVTDTLSAGEAHDWTFDARAGGMISLTAQAVAGGLDPRIEIYDARDLLVASNDDVDWPLNRNAVVEALGPPVSGSYRVRVSNVGQIIGNYQLRLLEGWSTLAWDADFGNVPAWELRPDAAESFLGEGRALLSLEPPLNNAYITRELQLPGDAWGLHVDITEVAGNRGWRAGIVTHWEGVRDWARFMVDDRGRWQYLINRAGNIQVLRPLEPHPAIQAGEKPESLGLVYFGDAMEFFFNRKSLGRLVEDLPQGRGRIGLYAASGNPDGGQVTAWYSSLKITVPTRIHSGAILPDWISGEDRPAILRQLLRQRLVPASGTPGMQVPESFVTTSRAGVSTLRLGGEQALSRFALGTSVALEARSGGGTAGCGLILETRGEDNYSLAWLDNTGSAGMSRRNGSAFGPGPVRSDLAPTAAASDQLLVIADGENLYFYANQQFVGLLPVAVAEGTVGIAAVSFDNLSATCRFRDTWIWNWSTEALS